MADPGALPRTPEYLDLDEIVKASPGDLSRRLG